MIQSHMAGPEPLGQFAEFSKTSVVIGIQRVFQGLQRDPASLWEQVQQSMSLYSDRSTLVYIYMAVSRNPHVRNYVVPPQVLHDAPLVPEVRVRKPEVTGRWRRK